ncbi:hypothetical protein KV564_26380 [Paenibacillus chitinolyticus]|nr:hypothetical protein [Paenibacillus chitinolyticus]
MNPGRKGNGLHSQSVCSTVVSLLSFSSSHIRAYFGSVILANHVEPLRAMVVILFENAIPALPGRPLRCENLHG